jgi:hypothetical protein
VPQVLVAEITKKEPSMTIDLLIARLEEYREELGGDTEVRLMTQQQWPFENLITGLASGYEINEHADEGDADVEADCIIYIVEGLKLCYGSKKAWEAAH